MSCPQFFFSIPQVYVPLPQQRAVEELLQNFWEDLGNFEKVSGTKMKKLANTLTLHRCSGETF